LPVTVESQSLIPGLPTLVEVVTVSGFVIVLVIFMLLRQEELRHRLVQVVGHRRLAVTTKALDEAGQRVSRYLIRQGIVNATFGVAVTLGLLIIGVPYAILWGVLGANLRFIPYLGGWMAVLAPTLVSLAVFPGWLQPIFVVSWMIVLELTMYMAVEPWFYGQGAGISEVALLIALAFWTWLWGPIGLVLGTPLTICLAVLGKYIPALRPMAVLIGESPPPRPVPVFYQRLVGRDEPEAARTAREYLDAHSREQLFDDVLVPALVWAKRDHEADVLTDEDKRFVLNATYRIAARMPAEEPDQAASGADNEMRTDLAARNGQLEGPRVCMIGWPARDSADEVALRLLALLLQPADRAVRITSNRLLIGETLGIIERERPDVVCIAALPPGGLGSTLHLVRRLRARMPEMSIVIGRWGAGRSIEEWQDRLSASGVDQVGGTIAMTRAQIVELLSAMPARA
jgi:AI-2E family transporter